MAALRYAMAPLPTGAQYAHLQATLDAQARRRSRNALRNVFNTLMDDAIMTPLFKYNYRISAAGVNGPRSMPEGGSILPAPATGIIGERAGRRELVYHNAFAPTPIRCYERNECRAVVSLQ